MGVVYRALELSTDRMVAVKVLHSKYANRPDFLKRFEREAKMLAKIEHPNVVPLLSVDTEDGLPVLIMKYIDGERLSSMLHQRGRMAERQVMPILGQLCSALDFLHERGAVHRDVKPQNIVITPSGHLTLLDFGVTRDVGQSSLTEPGVSVGTPQYMAPEQVLGEACDHRVDIFALGLMTYELITGEPALRNIDAMGGFLDFFKNPALANLDSPFVSPPVLKVIKKALARAPASRWESAGAFYEAFVAALEVDPTADVGDPAAIRNLPTVIGKSRSASIGFGGLSPKQLALGVTAAVILGIVIGFAAYFGK
jgi:serine/threonine protein kinase